MGGAKTEGLRAVRTTRRVCLEKRVRCIPSLQVLLGWTVALTLLAAAASACGSKHAAKPQVTAVRISEDIVPSLQEGESYALGVAFDYARGDEAVTAATVVVDRSTGDSAPPLALESLALEATTPVARGEGSVLVHGGYAPGKYTVSVQVTDARGRSSAPRLANFEVEDSVQGEFAVEELSPLEGKPGDHIVITGSGFIADEPSSNEVTFGSQLARAEVVAAAEEQLEVVVPAYATSGPLMVHNRRGARRSRAAFTVKHTVTLTPAAIQLVLAHSQQLRCLEAGRETVDLVWTLNGSEDEPRFGQIDTSGLYVAPTNVPEANPVRIRCASRADPTVFAEAELKLVPEVGDPGTGTAVPEGSEVQSIDREVVVTFPSGAVREKAPFRIEALDLADVHTTLPGYLTLVGASFPDAVELQSDAKISFALPSWRAPASALALLEYDPALDSLADAGRKAIVDDSGMRALGSVPHFSAWVLAQPTAAERVDAEAAHFGEHIGTAERWRMAVPAGFAWNEGLHIPVLVTAQSGSPEGLGPFLANTHVRWRLAAGATQEATMTAGSASLIQPSADGWALGVVLDLPVLMHCGAGGTSDAFLDISYPAHEGIALPFAIQCLDELAFDAGHGPSPLPAGAVQEVSDGQRIVTVAPDVSYRFSTMQIGVGGVLRVSEPREAEPPSAARFEVTGDVRVDGVLQARGVPGARGGNGKGADDSGPGGVGGAFGGGKGGHGGPAGGDNANKDGAHGTGPYGGPGGRGGVRWNNASWISSVFAGAKLLVSVASVFADPTLLSFGEVIRDAYNFDNEAVKYDSKDENRVLSAGAGGRAGVRSASGPGWWSAPPLPRPGGGGGGSGKMVLGFPEPDSSGAGGGGGGGAAANIEIIAGGSITFGTNAVLDGVGGNGGRGGNGSRHSWTDQAAPGGGGGGGSGAGLHLAARLGLRNNGVIAVRGGRGNLGGEVADDGSVILLGSTFGEHGPDGDVRLDGSWAGTGLLPTTRGAAFTSYTQTFASSVADLVFSLGSPGVFTALANGNAVDGRIDTVCRDTHGNTCGVSEVTQRVSYPLTEGLNVLSVARTDVGAAVEPHPFMRAYVFSFQGLVDSDGDGLRDRAELALGTNPKANDTDGDELDDFAEALIQHTDPINPDTDRDGFADGLEVVRGFDPLDPTSHPAPLPKIVSTAPVTGATGVSVAEVVTVTFSEPMKQQETAFVLTPATVTSAPEWSADGRRASLRPEPALRFGTTYTLAVSGVDLDDYPLAEPNMFEFKTEPLPPALAANGVVHSFVAGPDGTMYLAGEFDRIGRATGAGVPLDATTGALVEPFTEVIGPAVHSVVPDGAGGWWVGGQFELAGAAKRRNLVHLLRDGTVAAFDAHMAEQTGVLAVSVSDGRVYVAASETPGVRAFDAQTGEIHWTADVFGGEAVLARGATLYVGGNLSWNNGETQRALVALDAATGAMMPSTPEITGEVSALVWTGSTLYVGGAFSAVDGQPRNNLAALDASGALTNWNPGTDGGGVNAMAWDGQALYIGGGFHTVGGVARTFLAAVDASAVVSDWNPGEEGMSVLALAAEADRVYVGGFFWSVGAQARFGLAAYDGSGALLPWAPHPLNLPAGGHSDTGSTHALAVSNGVVYAGGAFAGMGSEVRNGLAAIDVHGRLSPWNPGRDRVYRATKLGSLLLTLLTDGRLQAIDMTTGALDWELTESYALTMVSAGDIVYLGGNFQSIGGVGRNNLAAVDANGVVTAWNPDADGVVFDLSLSDGVVYASGSFQHVGVQPRDGVAAIDATGAVNAWSPAISAGAQLLAATPSAIYLDSVFLDGQPYAGIAAFDLSGNMLPWTPALPEPCNFGCVNALAVEGKTVYAGGSFGTLNLFFGRNLAAVSATTGAELPFDQPVYGSVGALLVQGSRLWVGGDFIAVGYRPAQGFALIERP